MSDLSPEARALIEASRAEDEPSTDDRARVGRKLAQQLPAFAASAALAKIELDAARVAAQGKTAGGASGLLGSGLVKIASFSVAAMLAGSAAVVFVGDRAQPTSPPPSLTVPEPVPEPVPETKPPPPAAALTPVVEIAPRQRPARRAAPVERTPVQRPRVVEAAAAPVAPQPQAEPSEEVEPARIETSAREPVAYEPPAPIEIEPKAARAPARAPRGPDQGAKLLAAAREAFESGDPDRTLELTERHANDYPKSTLAEERIALRGLAFCALQRFDDGLRALSAARGAHSPLHAAALRACKSARPVQ